MSRAMRETTSEVMDQHMDAADDEPENSWRWILIYFLSLTHPLRRFSTPHTAMRVSILTAALAATPALAHPGMKNTFAEIRARQGNSNGANGVRSTEILGDLIDLGESKLSVVGTLVKQLLTGSGTPESDEIYSSGGQAAS
ncbi:hypothetical protein CTA2_5578, partial [Colletotrichum tanaceti]